MVRQTQAGRSVDAGQSHEGRAGVGQSGRAGGWTKGESDYDSSLGMEKREFWFREKSCTAIDDDKICGLIFNFLHLAAFRGKIDAFCACKPKEIFRKIFANTCLERK